MTWVRVGAAVLVLIIATIVALSPGLVYAPAPRIVLFFLVALLPAILLGAEATTRFEFRLPGFLLTSGGAAAVLFGALFLLVYLSKPEEQIAVFQIFDEEGDPVSLEWKGSLVVSPGPTGLQPSKYTDGNTLVLIFPEQLVEVEIRVKKESTGPSYVGMLRYAGSRSTKKTLGVDLKLPTK